MTDFEIGGRLKRAREARGLSQRQLAQRAGVTNGQISLIEQNKVSPSVSNLRKILEGLPLSLSEFFAEAESDEPKTFYRHDELNEIGTPAFRGPGTTMNKLSLLRVGKPGAHNLLMLYEVYEPGADTGQPYTHEAEEAGIVISGHIEISVGEEVAVLGPGDAYIFDSRRPHRFRNTGTETCIIVSASTPPTF